MTLPSATGRSQLLLAGLLAACGPGGAVWPTASSGGGSGDDNRDAPVGGGADVDTAGYSGSAEAPSVVVSLQLSVAVEASQSFAPELPMALTFTANPHVDAPSGEGGAAQGAQVPLYALTYELRCLQDASPYFVDRVDLYGRSGPAAVVMQPGVPAPAGCGGVEVKGRLEYARVHLSDARVTHEDASCAATLEQDLAAVEPTQPGYLEALYATYRGGYARRHILQVGRGLSWIWLKEYEPAEDRRELLRHSRASKAPGDQVRIYVPWLRDCGDDSCGPDIAPEALAAHGGHENPLLRGGLAMTVFALEYLSDATQVDSLHHALKLLDYVEASEYIDASGRRTGFFLRTRHPGNTHSGQPGDAPYFFASIDEIAGMVLGLVYLDRALEAAADRVNAQRVEGLATRMGELLADHHYFLVPPRDSGLPLERQRGWAGGHILEWYLVRGLRAITGRSDGFAAGTGPNRDPMDWNAVSRLPRNGTSQDESEWMESLVGLDLSAYERAVLAVQGVGLALYWGGQKYPYCSRLFGGLTWLCSAMKGAVCSFFGVDCSLVSSTHVDLTGVKMPRFNVPMLLHAFQIGAAGPQDGQLSNIRTEMARLIRGVLGTGASTGLRLSFIYDPPLVNVDKSETVGTAQPEDDFYAAAVAAAHALPDTQTADNRAVLLQQIDRVTAAVPAEFAFPLPAGAERAYREHRPECDPQGEYCSCNQAGCVLGELVDHNPEGPNGRKIGQAFVWEKPEDGNRTQRGGEDHGAGLSNDAIQALYVQRDKDAFVEGAGLGLLLPTALLRHHAPQGPFGFAAPLPDALASTPYLGACFGSPNLLARGSVPAQDSCRFAFPAIEGAGEDGNDTMAQAQPLAWGRHDGLSLSRQTHAAYRGRPYGLHVDAQGRQTVLPAEGDYDYYRVDNPGVQRIHVRVDFFAAVAGGQPRLVVDGIEADDATALDENGVRKEIALPGRTSHIVLVTGDMGTYSLEVE